MIWNWIKARASEVSTHFGVILAALSAGLTAANKMQPRLEMPMFVIAFLMAVTPERGK